MAGELSVSISLFVHYTHLLVNRMDNRSWNIGFLPYGSHWRLGRKIIHSQTHAIAAARYQPIQLRGARRFIGDLLAAEPLRPHDKLSEAAKSILPRLIRRNFTFTTVHMIYGIDVRDPIAEARYVDVPEKVLHIINKGLTPGRFLVDFLPLCAFANNQSMLVVAAEDLSDSEIRARMDSRS